MIRKPSDAGSTESASSFTRQAANDTLNAAISERLRQAAQVREKQATKRARRDQADDERTLVEALTLARHSTP